MRMRKRQTRSRVVFEDNHRSWICLTSCEMEVLNCLARGKSSDLFADKLHIALMSWLIQQDVDEGRSYLNFSEWGRGEMEADELAEVIREGEMPPR